MIYNKDAGLCLHLAQPKSKILSLEWKWMRLIINNKNFMSK